MGFQRGPLIELESWKAVDQKQVKVIDRRIALEKTIERNRQLIYGKHDLWHIPGQLELIWEVLKSKGAISMWDTFYKPNNGINCVRLGARIWDLKNIGVKFIPTPKVILPKSGKKISVYRLMDHGMGKDAYGNWLREEAKKYGY